MVADYNTMPRMFSECNRLYFGHSLPMPDFGLMKKFGRLARFEYNKNRKGKEPIKWQTILFSAYYDFDVETFRAIMVHEMIHYYLVWNSIKTRRSHGRAFMAMATELNEKYGLHITKTLDATTFRRTANAPTSKGFWQWIHH